MNKEEQRLTTIIIVLCIAIILGNIATIINTNKINKLKKETKTYCDETRCYMIYDEPIGPEYKPDVEIVTDEDGWVDVVINGE